MRPIYKITLAGLGFFGIAGGAVLAQQGATVNPAPGSVWTYLGPTLGADWVAIPAAGSSPQTANYIYGGPSSGPASVPTFRPMVSNDILPSPVLRGDPTAPTPPLGDSDTSLATTAFVKGQNYAAPTCKSIASFGGVGDDATDNVAAFTAAVAATKCVYFPPGSYYFAGPLTYTMVGADDALTLSGAGPGVSKLRWAAGDGLKVTYVVGRNSLHIAGLSFLAGGTGVGTAVDLVGTFTEPSPHPQSTTFNNVEFSGPGARLGTKCWNIGVRTGFISNINWNQTFFSGCSGPTGTGIDLSGGADASHIGVMYNVTASSFEGLVSGIRHQSNIQGVTVNQSNFDFNTQGVNVLSGAANTSQLTVMNSQFGYNTYGITDGTGVPGAMFIGNLVYSSSGGDNGIYMTICSLCVISSNVFVGLTHELTVAIRIDATQLTYGGVIQGNTFFRMALGIDLRAGTNRLRVANNQFNDVDVNIKSISTGVDIITSPATAAAEYGVLYTVLGAVNNGSGLVRLTLGGPGTPTANLVNGQMVLVTSVGGIAAASDNVITPIRVINGTQIDLLTVQFSGAYTSGGRLSQLP